MSHHSPSQSKTGTGRKYWQSLDQLAESPEFNRWLEREFPEGASECADPVSRRHFVKIMSASFMLAGIGLTGCRRPEEKIVPFTRLPEDYVHGSAKFYATSMPDRSTAMPLLVRSNEGRPTKVEGNPEHPESNGATDTYAQASILNLYDPDRSTRFLKSGTVVRREAAVDFLRQLSLPFDSAYGDLAVGNASVGALADAQEWARKKDGQGLCFLMERSSSPSRARLQQTLSTKFSKARWFVHEPVDFDIYRQAASLAFDQAVQPHHRLDKAKVILTLDADILGSDQEAYRSIRQFADGRRLKSADEGMNRLYAVEGLFTLTGSNADHRLRVAPSQVLRVAAQLAEKVVAGSGLPGRWTGDLLKALIQQGEGLEAGQDSSRWILECANDLLAHKGHCLVMAGQGQPIAAQLMAIAMNVALGNVGETVVYTEAPDPQTGSLSDLAGMLNAGEVDTLVILGGNPAYTAPADLDWAKTQRKARLVVRLGYYEDETSASSDWHLPLAHYLESWGDGRTGDGTLVAQQPLVEPLFGGISELEVLGRIAGLDQPRAHDIVRETFRGIGGEGESKWKKFLHDGYLAGSAKPAVEVQLNWGTIAQRVAETTALPVPSRERLELVFSRDHSVDDGRYNNNGWLQEWPDPITKVTWENVIAMSYQTAVALGLQTNMERVTSLVDAPRARVKLGEREIEGPVWVQPGMADYTLGLTLGYGRSRTGRVGQGAGYDAYRLRLNATPYVGQGATVSLIEQNHQLATTQNHWAMEGRPVVREANLDQYQSQPDFVRSMDFPQAPDQRPLYPNPLDVAGKDGKTPRERAFHQWGMVIDLNTCVGCSACVMACQSENNIPIVGKEQVGKSREMHWLRIDRYYSGDPEADLAEQLANPQSVSQPMLCQHCESAPCENVCPVNATVHDEEGLNLMVYNRCVGTRYCSNNCPYKTRRFNFFDYHRRPLDSLYQSPLTSQTDGEWELLRWFKDPDRGSRKADEWDLLKLAKNPDVTVRMRGVMEKCTFCIQRLEQAKITRKVGARDSGDVIVPDGAVRTACQQVCPAGAIAFGNLKDPNSAVAKQQADPRSYAVLEFLSTKPRIHYLARVRNPNPRMPDYHEYPMTTLEYAAHGGMSGGDHGDATGHEPAGAATTREGAH